MNLLVPLHLPKEKARAAELSECLRRNLDNSGISMVFAFAEDGEAPAAFGTSDKLQWVGSGERAKFSDLFGYANENLPGQTCAIANADIYFDSTIARVRNYLSAKTLLALSRWNVQPDGSSKHFVRPDSQDVWIFKAPTPPEMMCDWHFGVLGCDNRLAFEATRHGLRVINPSRTVRTHHLHAGWSQKRGKHLAGGNMHVPILEEKPMNWIALPSDQDVTIGQGQRVRAIAYVKHSHSLQDMKGKVKGYGLTVLRAEDGVDPVSRGLPPGKYGYRYVELEVKGPPDKPATFPWKVPAPLSLLDSTSLVKVWAESPATAKKTGMGAAPLQPANGATIANDQKHIAVSRQEWPGGKAGQRLSLLEMARRIREGMRSPSMRSMAGNVIRQAGAPTSAKVRAQALLDFVRSRVSYAPDPPLTEMIVTPDVTLCIEGAPMCIPIADCDDMCVALASLVGAAGIDVQVLAQDYGPDEQAHVLLMLQDDGGQWLAADPSSMTSPIGQRPKAVQETWMDPLNPEQLKIKAPTGEFIGVGRVPRSAYGATPSWTPVAPDANGDFAITAGLRYLFTVLTPATEPASGTLIPMPPPLPPIPWVGSGGPWTADDTTSAFASVWLVENVVPAQTSTSPGVLAWSVQGVAKQNMTLSNSAPVNGFGYSSVSVQTGSVAPGPLTVVPTEPPSTGLSTGAKVAIGAVIVGLVAGGGYLAMTHMKKTHRSRGASEKRRRRTRRA